MSIASRFGFRDRLVLLIFIVGIGSEAIKFIYDFVGLDGTLERTGRERVQQTLFRNSGLIEHFIGQNELDDVQWLLETLSIQDERHHSAVISHDGTILASNIRKFINKTAQDFSANIGVVPSHSINRNNDIVLWDFDGGVGGSSRLCVLVESGIRQNQCYQFVHWESTSRLRQYLLAKNMQSLAVQVIFTILLSIAVWLAIGSGIVARAEAIYRSAKRFQRGDLSARSDVAGDDELANISRMVDKSYDRLETMIKQTISAFNTSAIHSDPFTAGHAERVRHLCHVMGLRMGLDKTRLAALNVAAQVHDIGQNEVPSEIILSPKKLSSEEFDLIKQHPAVGAEILSEIDFPWPVSTIVLQHHENFDGSGYPQGLLEDQICLEARIIRLADTFESLVSHRPHRDALSKEKALQFIRDHAGRYFDPEVVKSFLTVIDNGYEFPEVLHIKNSVSRPESVSDSLSVLDNEIEKCEKSLASQKVWQDTKQGELIESVERSFRAIAKTLELRDPYTSGHQERVAELAVLIGQRLGLSAFELEGLRLAGAVHDIGKIKIPISILTKPGRLNEVEFELMRTHPAASYEILKELDMPWPVADIAHQHHEAWDGSGYPQGLKGDAILLQARILMVADIVESMSSSRPYRPAMGLNEAVKEIKKQRGIKLDPSVVDAFLACLDQGMWMKNQSSFKRTAVDI